MARNQVQFQKGLSEASFAEIYGTEEQCHAALVKRKRCEHTRACPGCSGGYVIRANRVGIQNWRMASTTVGMPRHAS